MPAGDLTRWSPSSTFRVLSGLRIDNTYTHTYDFFTNIVDQAEFFAQFAIHQDAGFTKFAPIRIFNKVRFPMAADDVMSCSYVMFRNLNYKNKWFYGFITDIEFININECWISYELDVIQTWMFDFQFLPCFVEREHVKSDNIGEHLVPEPLTPYEYVIKSSKNSDFFKEFVIVVAATFDTDFSNSAGGMYQNIYSGLKYNIFETAEGANQFILDAAASNKSNGIVSVFMIPKPFAIGDNVQVFSENIEKNLSDLDGYTPKNKKLFLHPFNFMHVRNNQGSSAQFKYEYFNNNFCTFGISCDTSPAASAFLVPINYKIPGTGTKNYNEVMSLTGFPQCAFNVDTFKAYVAQNSLRDVFNITTDTARDVLSYQGNMASAATQGKAAIAKQAATGIPNLALSVIDRVGNIGINYLQAYTMAPQAKNSGSSTALFANRQLTFSYDQMTITAAQAKQFDDFFEMYGYQVDSLKMPHTRSRKYWNYLKVKNAAFINNGVPFNHITKIKQIYEAGITLWHDEEIGNYERDNSV